MYESQGMDKMAKLYASYCQEKMKLVLQYNAKIDEIDKETAKSLFKKADRLLNGINKSRVNIDDFPFNQD